VSDQDFFFDEEDGAKPPVKASGTAKAKPAAPAQTPRGGGSFFEQSVSMSIAALMTVIALLVGVIIGFVIPTGGTTPPVATTTGVTTSTAPQLSEDQLNSGELPAGHPDLGSITGSSTATGSATTTGN